MLLLAVCTGLSTGTVHAETPIPPVDTSSDTDAVEDKSTDEGTTETTSGIKQNIWGIAGGFRIARIPYPAAEKQVADFLPLMFYEGDTFFIRGVEAGAYLYDEEQWLVSLIGRYRFFDIPSEYQNLIRGSGLDAGARLTYRLDDSLKTDFELMTDDHGRYYGSLGLRTHLESGAWDLFPYARLRIKSAKFNDYYFGLDGFVDPNDLDNTIDNKIGTGLDLTIGSEIRYHVTSNFYLLGRAQLTALDQDTRDNPAIDRGTYGELYLGIAFFNDKTRPLASALKAKPYVRLSHAWATPSNFGDILGLDWEDDPQNNQLTSVFYGHPVSDGLFGNDAFDIYLTLGYARHHQADPYDQTIEPGSGINTTEFANLPQVPCDGETPCTISYQSQPSNEFVLAIKAYYNFTWPTHWRLGVAEGLSYIDNISNLEQREMDRKGYRASNLMNFIDFTVDLSLGDLMGIHAIRDTYFGIGVHHRSSIFETSSAFGRIKGGSNYNAIYLQQHF
jgi:outer membrane protein